MTPEERASDIIEALIDQGSFQILPSQPGMLVFDTNDTAFVDAQNEIKEAIEAHSEELQAENERLKRQLEIKTAYCERNHAFCPDCRDKLKPDSCLRCQYQKLQAENDLLKRKVADKNHAAGKLQLKNKKLRFDIGKLHRKELVNEQAKLKCQEVLEKITLENEKLKAQVTAMSEVVDVAKKQAEAYAGLADYKSFQNDYIAFNTTLDATYEAVEKLNELEGK